MAWIISTLCQSTIISSCKQFFPSNWNNFAWITVNCLILQDILNDVDKLLYVDTDVLFVNEVFDVWQHFHKMNSSQLAALTPEHEEPNVGWYNRFARHPYYGELGNSVIIILNNSQLHCPESCSFIWLKNII